jgi:nascent polypeptide-associated complex subunit alpha
MFPGMNPKKMQAVMRQMGISQEEIDASQVIIKKQDNTRIVIDNPSVARVSMRGQETFQISGDVKESVESEISEEDIRTIIEKTSCSPEKAREVLEKTGDLAEAIMELSI